MAIKESSDELNPTVVTAGAAAPKPRTPSSAKDRLALAIATCGVGYLPVAPGTWGSLVGIACYLLLRYVVGQIHLQAQVRKWVELDITGFHLILLFSCVLLLVIAGISLVGAWAASRVETVIGRKDPGIIVIDEVAGQLVTFTCVPYFVGFPGIVFGFILFRFFDIVKPYPARRLELLPGGLGVMGDDLVAGIYAAIVLSVVATLSWLF